MGIVRGVFVREAIILGGNCPDGNCPVGNCLGSNFPRGNCSVPFDVSAK